MFMGGEFTGTYMYVKPQEKMPHIIDRMIEMESNMVKHHGFRMLKSVKIAQCKGSRN